MRESEKRFIAIWDRCVSLSEVAAATGRSKAACSVRAYRLRKLGHRLKLMPTAFVTPLAVRFRGKIRIEPSGCWLWIGATNGKGYGKIQQGRRGGIPLLAHRVSWELHRGPIPDGLMVLHQCDSPPCVNPDHLFLGTGLDNMRDMVAKSRHRFGTERRQSRHA
jgi:hypothetical protein